MTICSFFLIIVICSFTSSGKPSMNRRRGGQWTFRHWSRMMWHSWLVTLLLKDVVSRTRIQKTDWESCKMPRTVGWDFLTDSRERERENERETLSRERKRDQLTQISCTHNYTQTFLFSHHLVFCLQIPFIFVWCSDWINVFINMKKYSMLNLNLIVFIRRLFNHFVAV